MRFTRRRGRKNCSFVLSPALRVQLCASTAEEQTRMARHCLPPLIDRLGGYDQDCFLQRTRPLFSRRWMERSGHAWRVTHRLVMYSIVCDRPGAIRTSQEVYQWHSYYHGGSRSSEAAFVRASPGQVAGGGQLSGTGYMVGRR